MTKSEYLKRKDKREKRSAYAGYLCPKCWQGQNNKPPIYTKPSIAIQQKNRYGGFICKECLEQLKSS